MPGYTGKATVYFFKTKWNKKENKKKILLLLEETAEHISHLYVIFISHNSCCDSLPYLFRNAK